MICEVGIRKIKVYKSKKGSKYHIVRPWGSGIRSFCSVGVVKEYLILDIDNVRVCRRCLMSLNKTLRDKDKILKKLSYIL